MARPTKFNERYIEDAEKLATLGLSQKDMAYYWGVTENTVTNWKKESEDFLDALNSGNSNKKIALLKAMYDNATQKGVPAVQIFLAKNWLGMRDNQGMVHSGEIKADGKLTIEVVNTEGETRGENPSQ